MLHRIERALTENEGENSAYGMFLDKPTGKRQLGRPKMRWEDNGKIDLDTCIKGRRDSSEPSSSVMWKYTICDFELPGFCNPSIKTHGATSRTIRTLKLK